MAKIGEVLVREGHLTQEGLEEALDWQVLYGGRLGTNLLELKLVEEEQLARALGKQLGAEVAWGDLSVDPALCPRSRSTSPTGRKWSPGSWRSAGSRCSAARSSSASWTSSRTRPAAPACRWSLPSSASTNCCARTTRRRARCAPWILEWCPKRGERSGASGWRTRRRRSRRCRS